MTTRAIRNAIRAAFPQLETKHSCTFHIDEATRKLAGAQNVPIAIIEKIRSADIFVADITSVTKDENLSKSFPNPNVVFELGYAAAHLGWARIVLLFNKAIAEFKDLPFDFDRQRISPYTLEPGAEKAASKPLSDLVNKALDIIATENPVGLASWKAKAIKRSSVKEIYACLGGFWRKLVQVCLTSTLTKCRSICSILPLIWLMFCEEHSGQMA